MESTDKPLQIAAIHHKRARSVLGILLHGWEQLMIGSLALAAIAAALVVLTTASVIVLQRNENSETKREYEEYKLSASRDIAAAESRGKAAEQKAAEANERAAQAHAKALEAELALEKYRAPRMPSPPEITNFILKMGLFQGQTFRVATFPNLNEPVGLANRIRDSLLSARWEYVPPPSPEFLLEAMTGIQVWIHPSAGAKASTAAGALVSELNSINLNAVLKKQAVNNPVTDVININIGTKPQ
jgi:hypothetical protein